MIAFRKFFHGQSFSAVEKSLIVATAKSRTRLKCRIKYPVIAGNRTRMRLGGGGPPAALLRLLNDDGLVRAKPRAADRNSGHSTSIPCKSECFCILVIPE